MPITFSQVDLLDSLADYAHEAWSGWMRYMFYRCGSFRPDGTFRIKKDSVDRWNRLMQTNFNHLTAKEKESDYVEAEKMIEIMNEVQEANSGNTV